MPATGRIASSGASIQAPIASLYNNVPSCIQPTSRSSKHFDSGGSHLCLIGGAWPGGKAESFPRGRPSALDRS
jgi:hypothetical protein